MRPRMQSPTLAFIRRSFLMLTTLGPHLLDLPITGIPFCWWISLTTLPADAFVYLPSLLSPARTHSHSKINKRGFLCVGCDFASSTLTTLLTASSTLQSIFSSLNLKARLSPTTSSCNKFACTLRIGNGCMRNSSSLSRASRAVLLMQPFSNIIFTVRGLGLHQKEFHNAGAEVENSCYLPINIHTTTSSVLAESAMSSS